ncbi:histidine ammonia-lyase [Plesiocystis pacifica SIR-1]|uniref:Histidine ammonia-lyase n=1 Tax=Plesiocystis pacifica SIR-1 TaxID=391625 RepID=A6G4U3_9BACT|nr:histidine ammonia-lyase [Plesiocystis pacifica]EDM79035.1 histidine ammonia-lyase [Plesiocystis pacifica SIR-1]
MNQASASTPVTVGRHIDLHEVHRVARLGAEVALSESAGAELGQTRALLERSLAEGATIYGVNTGFGALSETKIPADKLGELQRNLLRSHAVGVGPLFEADVVRALLMLRAHTLALGASGVRPAVPEALLALLSAGLLPVVPRQGSVGASGDLAPLAHLALPVIGEGEVLWQGARMPASEGLRAAGLEPLELEAKEGLSLINGTQVTTAVTALAMHDARELLLAADIIGAMSLDAMLGTTRICDPRIHAGKPHPGQRRSAELIAGLIEGSALNQSHVDCGRVQDAYSLRCMPQVHGAARSAIHYVAETVEIELNSFTDNPLVLLRDEPDANGELGFDVLSGGNFHAGTVALPADHATAALTTLATISERRLDRLCNPDSSRGLPPFLAADAGLESGFMMAQVTAAALASESKAMSFPACVDTIPTSAGKEDHVSMGPIAARKLEAVVANLARVFAIEAATAARALDLREHPTSERLQAAHAVIREYVAPFTGDRSMANEFEALAGAIVRGELRQAADVALR